MLAAWSFSWAGCLAALKRATASTAKKIVSLTALPYQSANIKLQVFVLIALTACAWCPVYSAADTAETRRHEAERYLQATPPKALFEDIADKMAANLPPDQRDQFKRMMTTQLDIAALTKAMTAAMIKHLPPKS
jgi:hypothetical protein